MKFLARYIYLIPPIMIIATLLSHFIAFNYVVMGNILGYSILATLPMIYIFWGTKVKYCWFTKLAVIALPIMNVVSIVGYYMDYQDYLYIFEMAIFAITVALSIILTTEKKK